ncbi:MAG: hypothetical protein MRY79_02090 [Alphaproteobacteria bacterium]|nr:hypothetical protein [Alphaproteobacteria bacterium]
MSHQSKDVAQTGNLRPKSKEEARAAALRDNLKKRKAFQQGKKQDTSGKD